MEQKNGRFAVLVGCNYPNTDNELHGCINDVLAMKQVLLSRFGFETDHMEVLTDEAESMVKPTGANIKAALGRMMAKAEPGDVLLFFYSGHGTRTPSGEPGHPSRQGEAIVPSDFNLITDVDFRELVNRLPKGTTFTMISDSCHSGGLIDEEKEQIGPITSIKTADADANAGGTTTTIRRAIPFQTVLDHLTSQTRISSSDIGTHLRELFGGDAGLEFRLSAMDLTDLLETTARDKRDAGILLSGCQADEDSVEAEGAYGVFSNAIQMVLKENAGALTNKQLVMKVRDVVEKQEFQQHPCLYCSDQNADAVFLFQS